VEKWEKYSLEIKNDKKRVILQGKYTEKQAEAYKELLEDILLFQFSFS